MIVSEVRLNRIEFIACTLIPVSLPEFITERSHVMIQITGRIFYCRYRRMKCHFGHFIRLFITFNTNMNRNLTKKNCFASVHQRCIVFEELHNQGRCHGVDWGKHVHPTFARGRSWDWCKSGEFLLGRRGLGCRSPKAKRFSASGALPSNLPDQRLCLWTPLWFRR